MRLQKKFFIKKSKCKVDMQFTNRKGNKQDLANIIFA